MQQTASLKCSQSVKKLGADETFDYKRSQDEQLKDVASITAGRFSKLYDTTARSAQFGGRALREISKLEDKHFTSTGGV